MRIYELLLFAVQVLAEQGKATIIENRPETVVSKGVLRVRFHHEMEKEYAWIFHCDGCIESWVTGGGIDVPYD